MPISSNADGTVKVGKVSGYFSDTIHGYSNCVVSSFMSGDKYNYAIYLCNSVKIVSSETEFEVAFPAGRYILNNVLPTDKNQDRHIGISGLNAYYSVKNQFDEYYSYGTFAVLSV